MNVYQRNSSDLLGYRYLKLKLYSRQEALASKTSNTFQFNFHAINDRIELMIDFHYSLTINM
jgi:hypothetical protein